MRFSNKQNQTFTSSPDTPEVFKPVSLPMAEEQKFDHMVLFRFFCAKRI
jgi:hypothetical protein